MVTAYERCPQVEVRLYIEIQYACSSLTVFLFWFIQNMVNSSSRVYCTFAKRSNRNVLAK